MGLDRSGRNPSCQPHGTERSQKGLFLTGTGPLSPPHRQHEQVGTRQKQREITDPQNRAARKAVTHKTGGVEAPVHSDRRYGQRLLCSEGGQSLGAPCGTQSGVPSCGSRQQDPESSDQAARVLVRHSKAPVQTTPLLCMTHQPLPGKKHMPLHVM